jgi:hypothetical protein
MSWETSYKYIGIILWLSIMACNKKQVPQNNGPVIIVTKSKKSEAKKIVPLTSNTTTVSTTATSNSNTATPIKKSANTVIKKPSTNTVPRVITVFDNAAKKSIDGRLYYDLLGHRYWRNYVDGKYYLFNKSMYSDSAFKPR